MTVMTKDLQQAVRDAGDQPLRLTDPESNTAYVVLRAEEYERLVARADEEPNPPETYAAFEKVAGPAGWNDPKMDVYEQHRKRS